MFKAGIEYLAQNGVPWIHRPHPGEARRDRQLGSEQGCSASQEEPLPAILAALASGTPSGDEPTAVLYQFKRLIERAELVWKRRNRPSVG